KVRRAKAIYADPLEVAVVEVDAVNESGMAKVMGIEEGDFILQYHSWNYFSNTREPIDSFIKELNAVGRKAKTIEFCRKGEGEFHFFKVDFPLGWLWIHMTDSAITKRQSEKMKQEYKNRS
ncbi:MAG: hypothetical protein D3910_18470, partial [Candidatus Electrothrix sp. ATG2]|nr:hypothetical protein [Candidatus Electrothrix sp. ATG2]